MKTRTSPNERKRRHQQGAQWKSSRNRVSKAVTPTKLYPEQPPTPEDGLALDESERIRLIERYHRPAGVIRLSERVHALFHAVVENPLALADPAAVPRALQRLQQEGLTRHEARHALGAVLARHTGHVLPPGGEAGDARGRYAADLEGLSADSWRQRFAGDEEG